MATKTAAPIVSALPSFKRPRSNSLTVMVWRELRHNPNAMLGIVLLVIFAACAIFAPYIAPYNPYKLDFASSLLPVGAPGHLLGTDDLGRDFLSRLIFGSQVSLVVGINVDLQVVEFGTAIDDFIAGVPKIQSMMGWCGEGGTNGLWGQTASRSRWVPPSSRTHRHS